MYMYMKCQDLGVVMRENSTDVKVTFIPELRRKHFGSVDPRYSVIDEWDMEAARIELGQTNAGSSRSSTTYPMIILRNSPQVIFVCLFVHLNELNMFRLKMKRRWGSTMWNVCFLMSCIEMLALSSFSIDPVIDPGDRLNLGFTLVLTAVAFLFIVKQNLPPVSYLTFLVQLTLFFFFFVIVLVIFYNLDFDGMLWIDRIKTAFLAALNLKNSNHIDRIFLWVCAVYLLVYHALLIWYAVKLRREETTKLIMDSDEIENEVTANRPALEFDYRYAERQGNEGRLLAFRATQKSHVD
ncbi:hypothetical protein RFI_00022 [Reticulomyxa filosa]|uniref:Neurotransmitter-gated ion-channel transmembrane domain-containing protein n=1 Tax=Reticulomyxa filosa TaxID=46433 RepID=X6PEX0_RETFI|nr:hypothetical protein RFI_00022 [Reticulomyxa filosa]|eukprot:ETO37040.1 hypothetical protein RFI_00022 [Reticulomyxa filosa]